MRLAALFFVAASFCAAAPSPSAKPVDGVLLLAHGGDPEWDAEVAKLRALVDAKVPTEVALGMADPQTLQGGIDALAKRGVTRVVAVPLFVHSRSEVLDQTKYVLGLTDKPSEVLRAAADAMAKAMAKMPAGHAGMGGMHHHMFSLDRVKTGLPVIMTPALDADPFVSAVLLERAKALSHDAKSETVVLVAHGPVDDAALPAWQDALRVHAAAVQAGGKFKRVTFAVLRDDAPPPVRAAAVADMRRAVAEGAADGRAIVVPVLIARGGIEGKLAVDLKGLDYAWDGKTLMPHDGFDAWVLSRLSQVSGTRP
jgi:sirohydrochlorin ferrochelatase